MGSRFDEAKKRIDAIVDARGTGVRLKDGRYVYDDMAATEAIIREYEIDSESENSLKHMLIKSVSREINGNVFGSNSGKTNGSSVSDDLELIFDTRLVECLAKYDPSKSDSFYMYFRSYLTFGRLDEYKKRKKDLNNASFEELAEYQDDPSRDSGNTSAKASARELTQYELDHSDHIEDRVNVQETALSLLTNCCLLYQKMGQDLALMKETDKGYDSKRQELKYNQLFFSDAVVDFFRNGNREVNFYHERDLIRSMDEKYLECVFKEMPDSIKAIVFNEVRLLRELAERFADEDPGLNEAFQGIFKGAGNYDNEIAIPCEARIFIAALFLHDLASGKSKPSPVLPASVSRSQKRFVERMRGNREAWGV